MRCFHHEDREAVGTCKSCGKGLCRECAVDMGKGLACRGRCEQDVAGLIALIDANVRSAATQKDLLGHVKRNTYVSALLYLAIGGAFLVGCGAFWRADDGPGAVGLGFLGLVMFAYGLYALWRAWHVPSPSDLPGERR